MHGPQPVLSGCLGHGTPACPGRDSCAARLRVHLNGPARHGSHEQYPAYAIAWDVSAETRGRVCPGPSLGQPRGRVESKRERGTG